MDYVLNEMQMQAVRCVDGPLLILAGAGSGKTRTIVYRIAYILENKFAKPYQIIALTFTNKAAKEMQGRLKSFNIEAYDEMWIGTFHSICAKILRIHAEEAHLKKNFTIFDESDTKALLKRVFKSQELDAKDVNRLYSLISDYKCSTSNVEERIMRWEADSENKISFIDAYNKYAAALRENNAVDFDDLLLLTVRLLVENENVRRAYQRRFRYILVDEYQDTNKLQYEFVSILAQEHKNICVCGDEDQSIYSWRGAEIRNILEFQQDFENARIVKLEENYRSTKNILKAANYLIANNYSRLGKNLYTKNEDGGFIRFYEAEDETQEAEYITGRIIELKANGMNLSEIAVLFRINALSRRLETSFQNKGIAYSFIGGTRFFERSEVKDILSYLRLADNPYDSISFLRAISSPKRGIGESCYSKIAEFANFKGISLVEAALEAEKIPTIKPAQKKALLKFGEILSKIQKCNKPSEAVNIAILDSGYLEYISSGMHENEESKKANVQELVNAAIEHEKQNLESSIQTFLETSALVSPTDSLASSGSVNMMTIHSAKGLEFDAVFLCGMEEGIFPSSWTDSIEEERRLCYVAVTRAKKTLYITNASQRFVNGSTRYSKSSMFVRELKDANIESKPDNDNKTVRKPKSKSEDKLINSSYLIYSDNKDKNAVETFNEGDSVEHPQFGKGVVVQVKVNETGQLVTVAFKENGIKKIASSSNLLIKV